MISYDLWPFVSGLFNFIMFSGFIHVVACVSTLVLFVAEVIFHYMEYFVYPLSN